MDFFEEFSGLGALKSPEAKRARLRLYAGAVLIILAAMAALYQLGYL